MYKKQINIQEVADFVNSCSTDTKIYIGCDSERLAVDGVWYADYALVVVVHIDGNSGCKIFGAIHRERDYEHHVNKPRLRLMTEVYKISELYLELSQVVAHDIEVHLDLNPKEVHNSSIVVNEAIGYIKGMCGVIPLVKPEAFAASYGADRFKEIANYQRAA
jgi:predicted RNase H-related nuclease YkuK (DUF458 family)